MTICLTANLRGRVPQLPKDDLWIHNALTAITVPAIPIGTVHTLSVGEIALKIRAAVSQQIPAEQLDMQMTIHREIARRQDYSAYHGVPGINYYITSWAASGLSALDFSAALESDLPTPRNESMIRPGKVIFAGGAANEEGVIRRFWGCILSRMEKDGEDEGGYWCELACPRPGMWAEMEKFMADL